MKNTSRIFINLIFFSFIINAMLLIAVYLLPLCIKPADSLLAGMVFTIITASSVMVFVIGRTKKSENQALLTLSAIGLKFFLSLVFALVYFTLLKNTNLDFILLFFLLYLAFTIYLLRLILKILNIKSIKRG